MAHAGSSGSYERLRERVLALRHELAMAEEVLAAREAETRADHAEAPARREGRRRLRRAESTALVTRVALRRAALERRRDLGRMLLVGVAVSMATAALVVFSIRAIDARAEAVEVARPLAKLPVPAAPIRAPATVTASVPSPPPAAPEVTARPAPAAPPAGEPRDVAPSPWGGAAEAGFLTVICTPKCTSVAVDGVEVAGGHVVNRATTPGTHQLVLRAGESTRTTTVKVTPGVRSELRFAMDEKPAAARWGF